jgi:hypothetical protein
MTISNAGIEGAIGSWYLVRTDDYLLRYVFLYKASHSIQLEILLLGLILCSLLCFVANSG